MTGWEQWADDEADDDEEEVLTWWDLHEDEVMEEQAIAGRRHR